MVNVLRLEFHAAIGTEKMATARMIAGKGVVPGASENTVSRDGCGTIDSKEGSEQVEVDPLMSLIRADFASGEFADHQGVAGAIKYIANSDRADVQQHPVAVDGGTLKEIARGRFP